MGKFLLSTLVILAAGFLFAGCVSEQQATPTPVPSFTSTPTSSSSPSPTIIPTPAACVVSCTGGSKVACGQPCPNELTGICSTRLKFQTNSTVKTTDQARVAFTAYTQYLKAEGLYGENASIGWKFNSTSFYGYYQGHSYWSVKFTYYQIGGANNPGEYFFDEKGQLVTLVPCRA